MLGETFAQRLGRQPLQRRVGRPGGQQHDRDDDQQNDHHLAADRPDHRHGQDQEREIDQRRHGGGGEEIAQRFKLAHQSGKCPRRALLVIEPDRQQFSKHAVADLMVNIGAGDVDEIGAKHLQQKVEDDDDGKADRQRQQARHRIVGDDTVVNHHREQRGHQREDVDEHRCCRHLEIGVLVLDHRFEQPRRETRLGIGNERMVAHGWRPWDGSVMPSVGKSWPVLESRT